MTDDYSAYRHLIEHGFNHHYFVVHSDKEYVRGKIHTQNVENVWSILKRGIYGVYRVVSKNRKYQDKMFDRLLGEIANVKVLKAV